MDLFTQKRLIRFVEDFRAKSGQLPTLNDFKDTGINKESVETAVKLGLLEQFYVTLSNGTIVKAFKITQKL